MWTKKHKIFKNSRRAPNLETRQRLQVKLDKIALEGLAPPYKCHQPEALTTPLVLSSPHSGRHYPPEFLAQTCLTLHQLRQSEDCYVDQLVEPLTEQNIPFIAANFPRICLDLNRGPDEWPPETLEGRGTSAPLAPISPRARAGLGVVPMRVGPDTDIYTHTVKADLVEGRLAALYYPYHDVLTALLERAKRHFGQALLLDCHSMPGHDSAGTVRPDIVLGDRHGDSCHPSTIGFMESCFMALGYKTVRNQPYAGGYITHYYGQPHNNVEAVQIEINKDLYLNPDSLVPHSKMEALAADIQTVILQIKDYLEAQDSIAAE